MKGLAETAPAKDKHELSGHRLSEEAALALTNHVIERLGKSEIRFCLLRNRDRIPSGLVEGSDVDVVVPRRLSFAMLEELFRDLGPVHSIRQQPASGMKFYFPAGEGVIGFDFLNGDREWLGARFLSNEALLDGKVEDRGLPVASKVHQAFDAWFASLFWSSRVKSRYVDLVQSAARDHPAEFHALLAENFGEKLAAEILPYAANRGLEKSISSARRWRRAFWFRSFRRSPLRTVLRASHYLLRRLTLRAHPPGISVAVLGPDGAGKSSVCQQLADLKPPDIPFSRVEVEHLHRQVIPSPRDLRHGRVRPRSGACPVLDPHGRVPHTRVVSFLLATYRLVDQWLSYLVWERQRLARNRLVIHDRHTIELGIDPRRYRFGGSIGLARIFGRLAPQPDVSIILDAPAEVLQMRKREVPLEETQRQRDAYLELMLRTPHGFKVDASQPLEDVVADAKQSILSFMADRTRQRIASTAEVDGCLLE